MLPGFIDAHGHVFNVGVQAAAANLLAPPDGPVTDIASLQATLRAWAENSPAVVARTGWIIGMGYDDSQLRDERHPTRDDLDAVSKVTPVLLVHQSGHLAVLNSKGLEAFGYSAESVEPPGGTIRRGPAAASRTASSGYGLVSAPVQQARPARQRGQQGAPAGRPRSLRRVRLHDRPGRTRHRRSGRHRGRASRARQAQARRRRIPGHPGGRVLRSPGRSCRRATPGASASAGPSSRWTARPRARPRGSPSHIGSRPRAGARTTRALRR